MYSLDVFGIVDCLTRLRITLLTHLLFFASLPSALPTTSRVTLLTLERTLSPLFTQFPGLAMSLRIKHQMQRQVIFFLVTSLLHLLPPCLLQQPQLTLLQQVLGLHIFSLIHSGNSHLRSFLFSFLHKCPSIQITGWLCCSSFRSMLKCLPFL